MSKIKFTQGERRSKRSETSLSKTKKIVCFGGGSGTSMVLSGLKDYPVNLSAIITMFDSGGSSGKLRKEFGILPPGDIRQCLIATSKDNTLTSLFHYRFEKGSLKGHNMGNLLIVATEEKTGNLDSAISELAKILNIKTNIIPVTLDNADIKVILKNNKSIIGEENIINYRNLAKIGIKKLFLKPKVRANPKAVLAIKNADLIVIGPGKFYTSILPIFLVQGISEAIRKSRAQKVFICNLMTQIGNTDNLKVEDFVKILEEYLGENTIDYVIFNTGKLPFNLMKRVKKVFPGAEFIKYNNDLLNNKKFIGAGVLDRRIRKLNPADVLVKGANQRTLVFHDSDKLAKIIFSLCKPR